MTDVVKLLGDEASDLLEYKCKTVPKEQLHLPGPDFIDRVVVYNDRPSNVLRNMQAVYDHGRLGGRIADVTGKDRAARGDAEPPPDSTAAKGAALQPHSSRGQDHVIQVQASRKDRRSLSHRRNSHRPGGHHHDRA